MSVLKKFALTAFVATLMIAPMASAKAVGSMEAGPGLLPPLPHVVHEGGVANEIARSPWIGRQGKFRNTMMSLPPKSTKVAGSNTVGPRGGGETYIYLY